MSPARSREDQRIYANIHGQHVIKKQLAEAAKAGGWQWRTARLTRVVREEFRRGRWTIFVEWSDGGRIAGAGVYQTQLDEDGNPKKMRDDRYEVRYLKCGMVHHTRDKKGKVLRLLVTRDDDELMKKTVNQIHNEMIEDHVEREARVKDRQREWEEENFG